MSGNLKGYFGKKAKYYCDDESDCLIDGINYNEQTIMAQKAMPHLKNNYKNSEMASPDGLNIGISANGEKILGIVDQWNSRIIIYKLKNIISILNLN